MTKLYLIRHAEAEGNIYRRLHGQYDSRVTANGLLQIRALANRFSAVPIDAVYSSDLFRARKTAEALFIPKDLPLRSEPRFREVNLGVWEDLTFGFLERTEPETMNAFVRDPEHWVVPGAETYEQYSTRFLDALTEVAEAHAGGSAAVITHGCVLSGALHRLISLPFDSARSDNAAVSLLEYENGRFSPVYLFDNSHIPASISTRERQRWWRERGRRFNLWFREAGPADAALYDPDWTPAADDRVWIAMLDDEAAGYVAVTETGLSCLCLLPEYRFRRMGDQLLGQAVVSLRARGIASLTFGVPTGNLPAVAFFSRHGAVPVQMDDIFTVYRLEISVK